MKHHAYLGLGSNIGNRYEFLNEAIQLLNNSLAVKVIKKSSVYETDPVGFEDQAQFLNMVIKVETDLSPDELLNQCLKIELELGRKRKIHWGPRTIDIDLLLYENEIISTETLTVPHPRMCERNFVTVPLLEIAKNIQLPTMNQPLRLYVEQLNNQKGVYQWKQNVGESELEDLES